MAAQQLPDQVLFRVIACLEQRERAVALRVSKQWNRVANLPVFWRQVALSYSADDRLLVRLCQQRPWVEHLRLGSSRRISVRGVQHLATQLQRLTVLDMEGSCIRLDLQCLQAIRDCSNLRELNIGSCEIPDTRFLQAFVGMLRLLSLSLNGIGNVDDVALQHLLRPSVVSNPQRVRSEPGSRSNPEAPTSIRLKRLILSGCAGVSDAGLATIATSLQAELQVLSLAYCHKITDKGIVFLTMRCPNLVALNLYGCAGITDSSLEAIGARLPQLQSLDLSLCSNLSDRGLESLVSPTPHPDSQPRPLSALRDLKLYNCLRISDAGLRVLADRCKSLRSLSIFGLEKISADSTLFLLRNLPRLRKLDLGGCPALDHVTLDKFRKSFPRVDF